MKKLAAITLPLLLVLALGLAACGKGGGGGGGGGGNTIDMGTDNFVQTSLSIKAGDTVTFHTQDAGSPHVLCFGSNGQCHSNADGPSDFNKSDGETINPGESKQETFSKAGTYKITCTVHPLMELTVTVS